MSKYYVVSGDIFTGCIRTSHAGAYFIAVGQGKKELVKLLKW